MPSNVYNANWLASNLVRKYPLDSLASCIDDEGNYFPDEIITDIQIAYPYTLGDVCYISAATITANIVSIAISVGTTPIAALCTSFNDYFARSGFYYTLEPLYDGVNGLIALGCDKTSVTGSWTFTNPNNSRILPTCCTPYVVPNVLSLSRPDDSTPLNGNILLTSGGDIKLSVDKITIDGVSTKVIFIGLDLSVDPQDVLKKYITSCEVATSMNSCAMPYIESIGGAIPDCSGNVRIIAGDSGHMTVTTEDGIIKINTDIKLDEICAGPNLSTDADEDDDSKNKCPYPSTRSEDICPVKLAKIPIDYGFEGTDVDLYSNDVRISNYSKAGILYGGNPDNPNSIQSSDELPVNFDVKVHPDETVAVALSFPESFGSGNPKGSVHINIGNDTILIDNGNVNILCDSGAGDDRKYFGDLLAGSSKAIIKFTDDQLILSTSFGDTVLASIDDGLSGFGSDDYSLHVQMDNEAFLDGVRYV